MYQGFQDFQDTSSPAKHNTSPANASVDPMSYLRSYNHSMVSIQAKNLTLTLEEDKILISRPKTKLKQND